MQVEEIPDQILKAEATALRKFAPGPGNWATQTDLYHLGDLFQLPGSFPSVRTAAVAAKLRLLAFEVADADAKWAQILQLTRNHSVPLFLQDWFDRCHCKVLIDARNHAASQ
eukprot:11487140-Karenia_brevis.AAC.1